MLMKIEIPNTALKINHFVIYFLIIYIVLLSLKHFIIIYQKLIIKLETKFKKKKFIYQKVVKFSSKTNLKDSKSNQKSFSKIIKTKKLRIVKAKEIRSNNFEIQQNKNKKVKNQMDLNQFAFRDITQSSKLSKDAQLEYNILFPKNEKRNSLNISQISRNVSRFRESQEKRNSNKRLKINEMFSKQKKGSEKSLNNKKNFKVFNISLNKKPKIMNLIKKSTYDSHLSKNNWIVKSKRFSKQSDKNQNKEVNKLLKNKEFISKIERNNVSDQLIKSKYNIYKQNSAVNKSTPPKNKYIQNDQINIISQNKLRLSSPNILGIFVFFKNLLNNKIKK